MQTEGEKLTSNKLYVFSSELITLLWPLPIIFFLPIMVISRGVLLAVDTKIIKMIWVILCNKGISNLIFQTCQT